MQLKDFQESTLAAIQAYAIAARETDARTAFEADTTRGWYSKPKSANDKPLFDGDPPYVCVRVPTGGGKTILAARAIGTLLQQGLQRDHGIVLWLVPSNAIAEQTLKALRDPRHAYRRAVVEGVGSEAVQVYDLASALSLSRAEVMGETVIIVGTLQSFRVEQTEGRKVYDDAGALYAFREDLQKFKALNGEALDCLPETAEPMCSLRNVLAMFGPVVILDEAHNARTSLTFDTLARLRPAWLLELTATPDRKDNASNVLHKVYAAELKLAGLIKLPIELENAIDGEQALAAAKAHRDRLEALAQDVKDRYLRPICLVQAEPDADGNEWTVAKVVKYLKEELDIPADQVVAHTGKERGIQGKTLSSPTQPIRYIVTQKALVEGWDCPFAYVVCALAVTHSPKDVEQLLGRVLRQPDAVRFDEPALNRAYAVVRTTSFVETVGKLRERMVEFNGFEGVPPAEVIHAQQELPETIAEVAKANDEPVVTLPGIALADVPAELQHLVRATSDGGIQVTKSTLAQHVATFSKVTTKPEAVQNAVQLHLSLAQQGVTIRAPWLLFKERRFEEASFAQRPLRIDECTTEILFTVRATRQLAYLDAEKAQFQMKLADGVREPELPSISAGDDAPFRLATHVDQIIHRGGRHNDVPQPMGRAFVLKVLQFFVGKGNSIPELERARFRLAEAIGRIWDDFRQKQRVKAFQEALFNVDAFSSAPSKFFEFAPEDEYLPSRTTKVKFKRHLYREVAELNGEELPVAHALDSTPNVLAWVRNLDPANRGNTRNAFWLQTSTGKFYPDFVALLQDGRTLVVEYKGAHLDDNLDSEEKRQVGQRWQGVTGGCFEWVTASHLHGLADHWGEVLEPTAAHRAIVKTPGICGGRARLDNTRIPIWTLYAYWKQGADDAELLRHFPTLQPANLAAARAYMQLNRAELDADLAAEQTAEVA
jgi:type III restriction enzyme